MTRHKRERTVPVDRNHWLELRRADVTSTEVGALFGISPYLTRFELWHQKRSSGVVDVEPSERMQWGTRLQDAIAAGIGADRGWKIRRVNRYIRIRELRMGASYDFEVVGDETANFEIKNVDGLVFRQEWEEHEDGAIEAPPHIEIQVQHQMAVSGRDKAYLGVLIGGNRVVVLERTSDAAVIAAIELAVAEFWASVESGVAPEIDYARDAAFIASLYGHAEPGKVIESPDGVGDWVAAYRAAGAEEKSAGLRKDEMKARILEKIGDAERVLGDGFTISAGVVGPAEIAYTRDGYRGFRIHVKKGK